MFSEFDILSMAQDLQGRAQLVKGVNHTILIRNMNYWCVAETQ